MWIAAAVISERQRVFDFIAEIRASRMQSIAVKENRIARAQRRQDSGLKQRRHLWMMFRASVEELGVIKTIGGQRDSMRTRNKAQRAFANFFVLKRDPRRDQIVALK